MLAWQNFLSTHQLSHPLTVVSCQLNQHCIRIQGLKASEFLQGQFTCNIEEVTDTAFRLAAHCTPQGRVHSLGWLLKSQADYLWLLPESIHHSAAQTLLKYAQFSRVKVQPDASLSALGLAGPGAQALLEAHGFKTSDTPYHLNPHPTCSIMRLPGACPRYLVLGPDSDLKALSAPILSESAWQYFDIQAGISFLSSATQDVYLPHELNLLHLQALSLSKGCFIGQEVIARLHYLGKLKKHLWQVQLSGSWTEGEFIMDADQAIGQLVCYAKESMLGLALLSDSAGDSFQAQGGGSGKKIALASDLSLLQA